MQSQINPELRSSTRKYSLIRCFFFVAMSNLFIGSTAASAATISFSGLSGDFASPFTSYTESGFLVEPASGNWIDAGFGQPGPAIHFNRLATDPDVSDSITVTNDGATFNFNSVDLYSSITTIPYIFTGLLDSNTVFSVEGIVPNTFGNFEPVVNPRSMDSLTR